jgi:hypothetical protein
MVGKNEESLHIDTLLPMAILILQHPAANFDLLSDFPLEFLQIFSYDSAYPNRSNLKCETFHDKKTFTDHTVIAACRSVFMRRLLPRPGTLAQSEYYASRPY